MTESRPRTGPEGPKRAPRFAIRTSLSYRETGQTSWRQGRIENISRSGLLFRGEHALEPKTAVEMRFVLPVEVLGESAAEVVCEGTVVRAAPASATDTLHTVAATIREYCFVRAKVSRA